MRVAGWRRRALGGKPRGDRFLQPASDFSSHEWLYAPYVVPGAGGENATLYMLAHNEFHGWEHPGLCNATRMVGGRCWYNSVACRSATMAAGTSATLPHRRTTW